MATSGDYEPFSWSWPPEGFDPALARAYAADRGLRIEWVRFRWPELLADLEAGRFDVAMSGITVRPERLVAGRLSVPVAMSGAVVLVSEEIEAPNLQSLDRKGVRIAVNAGGHLERVARKRFRNAEIVPIADNLQVQRQLRRRLVHAIVSDTQEAPFWRMQDSELRLLGPFTRDRKAYLVAGSAQELARDLDDWLLEQEAAGRLASLRKQYLGGDPKAALAAPLPALIDAIERRMSLMPAVAEAKRAAGLPVEDLGRERRVLEAALAGAQRAALRQGVAPLDDAAVREFYVAQIDAAKRLQHRVLERARGQEVVAALDLGTELRPALLRIGEQMAELLVRLPRSPDAGEVVVRSTALLRAAGLETQDAASIATSLGRLCSTDSPPSIAQ